ncbi:TolC family outer membrane protein [Simplicispira psychrophila]|uniref:TolC family outer membrane protein n=1 Tax=Simplicispira psychrophila TaxID=80882 RepID=UPI00068E159B|nr:TolC family outer membrane protein [Simplicispira psychrophila]
MRHSHHSLFPHRSRRWRWALLALASVTSAASAADLLQAWQAAEQHDRSYAVARAAHAAAQPRRDQATALWRPNVALTAGAGVGTHDNDVRGAQFSAPGLGTSNGVDFSTSVHGGTATRWALQASQPLYNPQRRVQQQQLAASVALADVQWQAAQQGLMLRTAQQYFDVAVAQESLRVLGLQLAAVQRTSEEVQERFTLGQLPITDTHEARARLAGLRAQQLAAQSELDVKRRQLSDSTRLGGTDLVVHLPSERSPAAAPRTLDEWQSDAADHSPAIRQQSLALDVARLEADKHRRSASATLDLVAQVGQERLSGSGDFGRGARNKSTSAQIGVQLTVPLFTGGMRSAKEEEALRLLDAAQAQLDATREQVAQQVHAAWLGLSVGRERVQALAQALQASDARADATQLGHEVGDRTLLDLLNAQNDSASARLALAQARSQLLLERLRLAQLAGQLDDDTLRSVNQALAAAP